MMLLRYWSGHAIWLLVAALLGFLNCEAAIARNITDFPRPGASTAAICGTGSGMFICDPDRLLTSNLQTFKRLMLEMQRLRDGTPCFCKGCIPPTGSHRTLALGLAIAERIYIPPNVTNRRFYLRQFAHALRLHWAIGQCPGSENDALILYDQATNEIVYSFGFLVSERLGRRCVQRIHNYPNFLAFENRLLMAVHVLRQSARNPCCGHSCLYLNINWYKMLAWVCGGLVLLSALTFVGRRMWSRNLYIRTRPGRGQSLSVGSSGPFGPRPRCRTSGQRSTSRPRSSSSFPDGDIQLGGAHVLYSTQSPPPYPGALPGSIGVLQAPPYAGKPPAYSEVEFGTPAPAAEAVTADALCNGRQEQQRHPQPEPELSGRPQQQQPQQLPDHRGERTV